MDIFERFKNIISSVDFPFVIECGSCDGYHSKIMLEILEKSKGSNFTFHAFEPDNTLITSLITNLELFVKNNPNNVILHHDGIGHKNGKVIFYKSGGEKVENGQVVAKYFGSSSIREPKLVKEGWKDMSFSNDVVNLITLDSHLKNENKIVDFLWCDVMGAEEDMINGGQNGLKKVRHMYIKYVNSEWYEGQLWLKDILNRLPDFELIEDYGDGALLKNKNI